MTAEKVGNCFAPDNPLNLSKFVKESTRKLLKCSYLSNVEQGGVTLNATYQFFLEAVQWDPQNGRKELVSPFSQL